jgi:hypothetical protein
MMGCVPEMEPPTELTVLGSSEISPLYLPGRGCVHMFRQKARALVVSHFTRSSGSPNGITSEATEFTRDLRLPVGPGDVKRTRTALRSCLKEAGYSPLTGMESRNSTAVWTPSLVALRNSQPARAARIA